MRWKMSHISNEINLASDIHRRVVKSCHRSTYCRGFVATYGVRLARKNPYCRQAGCGDVDVSSSTCDRVSQRAFSSTSRSHRMHSRQIIIRSVVCMSVFWSPLATPVKWMRLPDLVLRRQVLSPESSSLNGVRCRVLVCAVALPHVKGDRTC